MFVRPKICLNKNVFLRLFSHNVINGFSLYEKRRLNINQKVENDSQITIRQTLVFYYPFYILLNI